MDKLLPIFSYNMTVYQNQAADLGWNRTKCSQRARMSKGQWSDLLNGKISHPSVWTAKRVADALCVSVDDLITFDQAVRDQAVNKVMVSRAVIDKATGGE